MILRRRPCDNGAVPPASQPTSRLRVRARRAWMRAAAWTHLVRRALWRGSVRFYNSDDLTYAASVAYYALLSVFPFFLLLFSLLGAVTTRTGRNQAVVAFLTKAFPGQIDFLVSQLDALQKMRLRIGVGGALGLVWAAHGFFSAISSAVNHAWGVETPRSYVKHKIFAFFMLLAAGAILSVALGLVSAYQVVQATWFADNAVRIPALGLLGGIVVRYAVLILFVVVVGLVYYFVPSVPVRARDVWPGAILTGALWQIALEGFSFYLRDMHRSSVIHGSIAAVVVFLVWVYVSSVILLYGVQFTAAYARLRRGRPDSEPAS